MEDMVSESPFRYFQEELAFNNSVGEAVIEWLRELALGFEIFSF